MIIILNKILFVIFFMCLFNTLKHVWVIISRLRQEVPNEYKISPKEKFLLGLSLSYIITVIITGIQL